MSAEPEDSRPVVAHCVAPYLPKSGSWIHSQIALLERWRAIVLTKRIENHATFPFEPVYSRERLGSARRAWENARLRLGLPYFGFHRRALLEHRVQLLHSHFGDRGWRDLALKRELGLAQITSFYGADIWKLSQSPLWCERYREHFREGELFLVEGSAMRAKVLELGCPAQKVRVQHLGVQLGRIAWEPRTPLADGTTRFLASGRMVEKKGHELAVRAFARVHRENPRTHLGLILIPPDRDAEAAWRPIHAAIAESGVAHAITLHGYLPYPQYLQALRSHHVFVAPSRHAADGDAEGGAPVALIEISAAGMPVVASRHCDIPEVVLEGESGLLFDENDVDAMAGAMLEVAAHPERWRAFAAAGRAHVEREFDASTQARRLEKVYDEVLSARAI